MGKSPKITVFAYFGNIKPSLYYGKFFVDNFEKKFFFEKKTIFDVILTSKSADFGTMIGLLGFFRKFFFV